MTPSSTASLDQLPTWVLVRKAAANRALVATMCQRLAEGQPVARMYQADGLAWLERQADTAEAIIATRQAAQPQTSSKPAGSKPNQPTASRPAA